MLRKLGLAVAVSVAILWAATSTQTGFDENRYLQHIKYLSAEDMRGRATGSPELEKAAEYIAQQFRAIGLQPVDDTYLQAFPVTTSAKLGHGNHFQFTSVNGTHGLKTGEEF